MGTTRHRTGAQQLGILWYLAGNNPEGMSTTAELAWSLTGTESGSGWRYSAVMSSLRRTLAQLQERGLVRNNGYYVSAQGRPAQWEITRAGVAFLAQHNRGKS
jgi:hypothetical protein